MFGHGEGFGRDSRGPFAHPGCARGPLLDLAQALLTDELLALRGHAVYIQVVEQQRFRVLAQGIGLDHTLCEHTWVLSAEEKLDPRHPVLADQEGWHSCSGVGGRENTGGLSGLQHQVPARLYHRGMVALSKWFPSSDPVTSVKWVRQQPLLCPPHRLPWME